MNRKFKLKMPRVAYALAFMSIGCDGESMTIWSSQVKFSFVSVKVEVGSSLDSPKLVPIECMLNLTRHRDLPK